MAKKKNILDQLNPRYFWDVDISQLDSNKSKRLIVERVLALGTSTEFQIVINEYGKDEVANIIKSLNYIDPKTLNFASLYFQIPLDSFKCYMRNQSSQQHWSS